jgi:hypothetical protein
MSASAIPVPTVHAGTCFNALSGHGVPAYEQAHQGTLQREFPPGLAESKFSYHADSLLDRADLKHKFARRRFVAGFTVGREMIASPCSRLSLA